jgi:hypothetical protein
MKIGGWRTRSVFERYAIVNRNDMADAVLKREQNEKQIENASSPASLCPVTLRSSSTLTIYGTSAGGCVSR